MDSSNLPATPDEYITFFRQLAAIIYSAMDSVEKEQSKGSLSRYNRSLDRLAHNVDTIACLRGDSGMYYDSRPAGLGPAYQTEMYKTEDALRRRLIALGYIYPSPYPEPRSPSPSEAV